MYAIMSLQLTGFLECFPTGGTLMTEARAIHITLIGAMM